MRRVGGAILGVAVVGALALTVFGGASHPYVIRLQLADAAGLRPKSPVMIGGVQAGTISLHLGAGDQVIAELSIDKSQTPVGKDASVAIAAVNFLGQKEAELTRGNLADPAPSGYVIPASRVTISTDLDQVLDVLDASTRARLAILIDEAGTALTGRRADFSQVLAQLPHSLTDANALLSQLVSDNHTLAHLVTTGNQFVAAIAPQRTELSSMIDVVGQTAVTVAARRAQLRQTLSRAPATLATVQTFLGKLQATTTPLGPAAQNIAATAPYLSQTLAQVDPFRRAADPTLRTATQLAPDLTKLAVGATPVLVQANPVARSLATFSTALQPVSGTLNRSVDNLLAIVENWSRAIQFRDGLSHVFRGEAGITPDTLTSIIDRLLGPSSVHARGRGHARSRARALSTNAPTASSAPANSPAPSVVSKTKAVVGNATGLLKQLVNGATGAVPRAPASSSLSSLLNYLVGR